jgi:hypothetical protein
MAGFKESRLEDAEGVVVRVDEEQFRHEEVANWIAWHSRDEWRTTREPCDVFCQGGMDIKMSQTVHLGGGRGTIWSRSRALASS